MKDRNMKKLNEELEDVLDKHLKNRLKPSNDVVNLVRDCASNFGGSEQALCMCLVALAHALKHCCEHSEKNENDLLFETVNSDVMIKMMAPFASQILSVKRFE